MPWVRIGGGNYLKVYGKGEISVSTFDGEKLMKTHLSRGLYVPQLKYNLFSPGAAIDKGLELLSNNVLCKFVKGGRAIALRPRITNKLFAMKFKVDNVNGVRNTTEPRNSSSSRNRYTLDRWHRDLLIRILQE